MKDQLHVIDDFYNNPDDVRANALLQSFEVRGNYPGLRTQPVESSHSLYLKKFIEDTILHRPITYWSLDDYNTSFQYTTENDTTWVHHDATVWAGVLYLTPNPPPGYGTSIYSRKDNGVYECTSSETEYNQDSDLIGNLDNWRPELVVENRYNRLILYRGALYHRSSIPGFGTVPENSRLFQVFFFDTDL